MASGYDWIVPRDYYSTRTVPGATQIEIPLLEAADLSQRTDERMHVVRVVGKIEAFEPSAGFGRARIHERIRVGVEDLQATAYETTGPLDSTDVAEERFLWERFRRVHSFDAQADPDTHPYWELIDCKVKRTIVLGEALVLSVLNRSPVNCSYSVFLRVLVRV